MESALKWATWTAAVLLAAGLVLTLGGSTQDWFPLHAGLWFLIGTPIVRVLMALYDYGRERNWAFVAVTLIVFASVAIPLASYFLSSPR